MPKTALHITDKDLALYRATAQRRAEEARREMAQRFEQAHNVARQAAALLKEKFGAGQVVLFGSVAGDLWFHHRSDIDLAAEGISPQDFWRAWAALDTLDPEFEIDLVALETVSDSLRHHRIAQEGVALL